MDRLNFDKVKIFAAATTLAMFAGVACAHVEVSGLVNATYLNGDDGYKSSGLFGTNDYMPSHLGIMAKKHLNECFEVGGVVALMPVVNNTRIISQLNLNSTNEVIVRKADVFMSYGMWGKLSLGYGDAASWGITNMSFSGTNETVIGVSVANTAGGYYFAKQASPIVTPVFSNPQIRDVFQSLNGIGDIDDSTGLLIGKNRVRYDTAEWNGFSLGVSYGTLTHSISSDFAGTAKNPNADPLSAPVANTRRTFTDAAIRYMGHFCDFNLSAGIAWAYMTRDGLYYNIPTSTSPSGTLRGTRTWSGSIAAEHKPTDINAAVAFGKKRFIYPTFNDYQMWYGQLGKKFCFTHHGKTKLAIEYFGGKNAWTQNAKGTEWGVGVAQDLNKVNTELYASLKSFKLKNTSTAYHKIFTGTVGVMFKFGATL